MFGRSDTEKVPAFAFPTCAGQVMPRSLAPTLARAPVPPLPAGCLEDQLVARREGRLKVPARLVGHSLQGPETNRMGLTPTPRKSRSIVQKKVFKNRYVKKYCMAKKTSFRDYLFLRGKCVPITEYVVFGRRKGAAAGRGEVWAWAVLGLKIRPLICQWLNWMGAACVV